MEFPKKYLTPSAHALYLHIPFCKKKCSYCDFYSFDQGFSPEDRGSYAGVLSSQIKVLAASGLFDEITTAYIGGGTPSFLADELTELAAAVTRSTPQLTEFSVEANPESFSVDLARELCAAGVTRVSLGVQSFIDRELQALGRIHSAEKALDALREAVAVLPEVSCDLMCAIPYQSSQSWESSLSAAVDIGVTHVSVYPLTLEEKTPLFAAAMESKPGYNDPDIQADRMEAAEAFLSERGFSRYETASYAKDAAHVCQHNLAYWTAEPYLGLGAGASSMLTPEGYLRLRAHCPALPELPREAGRIRLKVISDISQYLHGRSLADLHFSGEFLSRESVVAEDLMLAVRTAEGVGPELFDLGREYFSRRFDAALEELTCAGLLLQEGSRAYPTHKGWLLGNNLFGRLWDLNRSDPVEFIC